MQLKKIKEKFSDFVSNITRSENFTIFSILLSIIFIGMIGTYFFEHQTNKETFNSFFDTLWYTIVTLTTVGYGDKTPITTSGRLFGILIMIFGVAVTGVVTGKIASFLVERQLREGRGLMATKKLKKHFIICGWKENTQQIILDILTVNNNISPSSIVLINQADSQLIENLKSNPKLSKIKFIRGDYTNEAILMKGNIQNAKTVLILSDITMGNTPQEIDSRVVMTAITIESITKNAYVIAELLDNKFEKYLKMSHVDEVLLSRQYNRILLANSSTASGISHIVNDLISVENENPMTTMNIPETFVSKTYKDLFDHFVEKKYLLIGILENTGNLFKRKKVALKEAQKTPDISKLIVNLQEVKKIEANKPVLYPGYDYIIKPYSKAIVIPEKGEEK